MTDYLAKLPDRFWNKVQAEPNSGCWLWTGYLTRGYGQFNIDGQMHRAHRLAYERLVGPIPESLDIDHICRIRNCVNPEHLEPVTRAENIRRGTTGQATGQRNQAKTHCTRGHPYSGDNLYTHPAGGRKCRACQRANRAAHSTRKQSGANYAKRKMKLSE